MKRIISMLLAFMLVFTVGFALASCGGGDETCTHTDANTDGKCDNCSEVIGECAHADENSDGKCDKCSADVSTPSGDGVALVSGGKTNFQLVVGSSAKGANTHINNFLEDLNALLDEDAERVNDTKNNVQDIEILVGSSNNRGDAYKIDEHYLGHKGYAVKIVGTKVMVLAGDEELYEDALDYLYKDIFGIKKSTKKITDLTVTEEQSYEKKTTGYTVESVTIAGNDMRDYVIALDKNSKILKDYADTIQPIFYRGIGVWLDIVDIGKLAEGQKAIIFRTLDKNDPAVTYDGYRAYVDEAGNLVFETCFPERFVTPTNEFLVNSIVGSTKSKVSIAADYEKSYNLRDIYYSEFGAKGDGYTDDFEAIRACHEYANEWGHVVNSDGADKSYYLGMGSGNQSIIVQTDTNWHGCTFIFDDSESVPETPEWNTPRFKITSDHHYVTYTGEDLPITSLESGADNIGFAPGYKAMAVVYDERAESRLYFRYGVLADDGDALHEVLLIDENGNVDSTTPVQWDYTTVTRIILINVDDAPITISGGDGNTQATFETIYFQNLTETKAYTTGDIRINRSNVVLKNIYHKVTNELLPGETEHYGASYDGFTNAEYCNNVTFENLTLYRYNLASYNTHYRSYEIRVGCSNNMTWRNCNMSNFFDVDGSVRTNGMMGTNYTKNMYFDNVEFNTFDAHRGSYNVTIENSTLVYCSIIGAGKLTIRDTVFYTTRQSDATHAIWIREDYGSHYDGDIEVDGVTLKYADRYGRTPTVSLISVVWHGDHYFGYETRIARNITINNVKLEKITYGVKANGERWEESVAQSRHTLHLFPPDLLSYMSIDISTSPTLTNGAPNLNPYKAPDTITITNCEGIEWVLPTTPQFDNTVITVDGEVQ